MKEQFGKKLFGAGLLGLSLLASASLLAEAHEGPHTLIHAGEVLAVPGEPAAKEQTIIVVDGKVTAIQDGYMEAGEEDTLIDLSDHFVMPGMIDSHVHLRSEWNPNTRLQGVTRESGDVAFEAAMNARKTLMAGFTAVQDPTICDGVADCRRAVRKAVKRGADVIKITATGGVLSNTNAGTGKQFFDDELRAIVETAESMGRKVTAHAHGKDGIDAALRAGVSSIEHGTYLDKETVALFKKHDAVLVPTVLAGMTVVDWAENHNFLPPNSALKALQVGPQMQTMLRIAWENGVTVAFGTDTGVSAHGENAREFEYMIKAGMSEMDAIKAATVVASKHIGMSDQIGTLEAGKDADIIAVDGSPLEDISELMDVDFVMKGGVVYKD